MVMTIHYIKSYRLGIERRGRMYKCVLAAVIISRDPNSISATSLQMRLDLE